MSSPIYKIQNIGGGILVAEYWWKNIGGGILTVSPAQNRQKVKNEEPTTKRKEKSYIK